MSETQRSKTLSELQRFLQRFDCTLIGDGATRVASVCEDSRRAATGSLFVARRGAKSDGRAHWPAARQAGAVAVVCEPESIDFVPRLEVRDLRRAFGAAAQFVAGQPSHQLKVIGITGTNGKTTCASLVAQALSALGHSTARLGTLGFFIGEEQLEASLTTPPPDLLAGYLAACVERRVDYCVCEVSSHALDQERTAGVKFSTVAFSNLSQDHLDYHGTFEAYGAAKLKLFTEYESDAGVFNVDDAFVAGAAARVFGGIEGFGPKNVLRVSQGAANEQGDETGAAAMLRARDVRISAEGIEATVQFEGDEQQLRSPLIGAYNLDNLLLAAGILLSEGEPLKRALHGLSRARGVAGRMERCEGDADDLVVVVDYAHTPDALAKTLDALRALAPPHLVCVFGCGGDRDRSKRPLMACAAAERADEIWLTSDNPRTEDPHRILSDARAGLSARLRERKTIHERLDRAEAIAEAIAAAPTGSILLIAGKGHETYQLVGSEVRHFDDREHARWALERRRKQEGM